MAARDIIVIGASSGGVDALKFLFGSLPADLPAAVFVVLHIAPRTRSLLPQIISSAGPLKAEHPKNGAAIEPGCVYVAPPDHHLVVEAGHVHVSFGPKEQHQRPSINVTFRTAAQAYGARVAGVVLTGELDDGTAGLWEIKRRGGVGVVQHPEEAAYPSMPLSALKEIAVDYVVRLADAGPLLAKLASEIGRETVQPPGSEEMARSLTDVTCPECRGTIWEERRGSVVEYRCRVGHTYSPKAMLAEHFAAQERVMWSAIVAMEEAAALAERLEQYLDPEIREELRSEARQRQGQAAALRQVLLQRRPFALD
jgi:two-component system chemotaxis response regulator CheB